MQGDYMTLDYAINRGAALRDSLEGHRSRGTLVLELDDRGIATFARLDDGSALGENEARLRFRRRGWRIATAPASFFFQEGQAERYGAARYGVLRLSPDGVAMLVGLAGRDLAPL
jgi:uncharacterized membrane-anchored protein